MEFNWIEWDMIWNTALYPLVKRGKLENPRFSEVGGWESHRSTWGNDGFRWEKPHHKDRFPPQMWVQTIQSRV
jgi:hypothetical protein